MLGELDEPADACPEIGELDEPADACPEIIGAPEVQDTLVKLLEALGIHVQYTVVIRQWHLTAEELTDLIERATKFGEAKLSSPNFAVPTEAEKSLQASLTDVLVELYYGSVRATVGRCSFMEEEMGKFVVHVYSRILKETYIGIHGLRFGAPRFFFPWDAQSLHQAMIQNSHLCPKHVAGVPSIFDCYQLSCMLYWWISGALPPTLLHLINELDPELDLTWIDVICEAVYMPCELRSGFSSPNMLRQDYHGILNAGDSLDFILRCSGALPEGKSLARNLKIVFALLALARSAVHGAWECLFQKFNYGSCGRLKWRSYCPWIHLDVSMYRSMHAATLVHPVTRLPSIVLLGRLRRLQLTNSHMTTVPIALYLLWALFELDVSQNPLVPNAFKKTLVVWNEKRWCPRILADTFHEAGYHECLNIFGHCPCKWLGLICEGNCSGMPGPYEDPRLFRMCEDPFPSNTWSTCPFWLNRMSELFEDFPPRMQLLQMHELVNDTTDDLFYVCKALTGLLQSRQQNNQDDPNNSSELSSTVSTSISRSDNLQYIKEAYGASDRVARLYLRAERLQEKGQLDQAIVYYQEVLHLHPSLDEARTNLELVMRVMEKRQFDAPID